MFSLEEIANLLTVLVLLVGLRLTNRLGELAFWVFLGRSAMVFLTNDVLFPVSYMPDQLGYLNCASMRRGGDPTWCMALAGKNVLNASWFFAYFPLPFIVSVRSTSLMNVVLITLLFVYLDRRGFFSERAQLFYLFYPSFVLYAAIGGRDVLIMFCMFMAVYNLIERRNVIIGLCWILPLFMISTVVTLILGGNAMYQSNADRAAKRRDEQAVADYKTAKYDLCTQQSSLIKSAKDARDRGVTEHEALKAVLESNDDKTIAIGSRAIYRAFDADPKVTGDALKESNQRFCEDMK